MQTSKQSVVHRTSIWALRLLPAIGGLAVATGFGHSPRADESSAAHVFQLMVVLSLPALLAFAASADWGQRGRCLRPLAIPAALWLMTLAALYMVEHQLGLAPSPSHVLAQEEESKDLGRPR